MKRAIEEGRKVSLMIIAEQRQVGLPLTTSPIGKGKGGLAGMVLRMHLSCVGERRVIGTKFLSRS